MPINKHKHMASLPELSFLSTNMLFLLQARADPRLRRALVIADLKARAQLEQWAAAVVRSRTCALPTDLSRSPLAFNSSTLCQCIVVRHRFTPPCLCKAILSYPPPAVPCPQAERARASREAECSNEEFHDPGRGLFFWGSLYRAVQRGAPERERERERL